MTILLVALVAGLAGLIVAAAWAALRWDPVLTRLPVPRDGAEPEVSAGPTALLVVQVLWVERVGAVVAVDALVVGVGTAGVSPTSEGSLARFRIDESQGGPHQIDSGLRRCLDDDLPCVVVAQEGNDRVSILVPFGPAGDHLELRAIASRSPE